MRYGGLFIFAKSELSSEKKKKKRNSQSYQFDDLSAEFILLINSFTVPRCYVILDIFPPSFSDITSKLIKTVGSISIPSRNQD